MKSQRALDILECVKVLGLERSIAGSVKPTSSQLGAYTGAGHTIRIFSIYNADFRTWQLHTVPGLRTMVSLFLIVQQTRLTLTPSKIYGVL